MNKKKLLEMISKKEARKAELATKSEKTEDVKELRNINSELEAINGEITELRSMIDEEDTDPNSESFESRSAAASKSTTGKSSIIKINEKTDDPEDRKANTDPIAASEYRSAFLKKLQGNDLTEAEQRAFTVATGSAGAAVPTFTQNRVIEVVKQYAPLLAEINLLQVPGGVRIPIEDVVSEATKHAENATITVSEDSLNYVDLFGYEITKLLQISKSVTKMTVDAFETWLVNNLGKSLANKITSLIIKGSGDGEATGVDSIVWDVANSITVAMGSNLTAADVTGLIALLPGGYDANGKFLLSKKTLFTDFMPLKDASKHDLVTREGNNYFIYGYPVLFDERVTHHEAYLGDFKAGYYGNLPEDINVTNAFDINTNSYKYLGAAMFDGKVALPGAFVKLIKAEA